VNKQNKKSSKKKCTEEVVQRKTGPNRAVKCMIKSEEHRKKSVVDLQED
jgi:hypothetical protein